MIFDITYSDRIVEIEMNRLVGKPYGWLSKERWSGIGSQRLMVAHSTGEVDEIFQGDYRRNFANIELRPKGIVIRIRYRLEVFAVAIPYSDLNLDFTEKAVRILLKTGEMQLVNAKGGRPDARFFEKVNSQRT